MKYKKCIIIFSLLLFLGQPFFALAVDTPGLKKSHSSSIDPNATSTTAVDTPGLKKSHSSSIDPNATSTTASGASSSNTNTTGGGYASNMEKIPGQEPTNDLIVYLNQLYKFGIGIAAILALFMIALGAFTMIIGSAGNASKMVDGKDMITSALYGLVLAFTAYLVLFIVNPDLVSGTIKRVTTPSMPRLSTPGGGTVSLGKCEVVASGDCSVENLKKTCLASNAETFSKICGPESGGNAQRESGADLCADGNSFSAGLFQYNLFNGTIPGCDGSRIFDKTGDGPQGECLKRNSKGICLQRNCRVKDPDLYATCMAKAKDAKTNIDLACKLSNNGSNLKPWATTVKACGL